MRAAWERLSLRARLIVVGVLGVATALAFGSVALYEVLTVAGARTLDASARATGAEVASLVRQHRLPDPIPVTGSQVVQVVDGRNRVVSASVNADRLTALLSPAQLRAAASGSAVEVPGSRLGLSAPLRAKAWPVDVPGGRQTVVVAQQVGDIQHSQNVLKVALLVTYPLLLLALAAIAWRVVGAALRPVEALRSSAERISDAEQDARLPVPPSSDEVHALAVTLNSMLDRLADARARQRAFVADAAHELRSPLASMRTQLDVSRRLEGPTPVTDDLLADVQRLSVLVEDLLLLARLDAAGSGADPVPATAVAPLVAEVSRRYATARVPVTASGTGPGRADVAVRADDLRRALVNLLDNAVRHARTAVQVGLRADGPLVVVEVSDDGTGIPAADRDRVFERFTRLDDARDRDAGGSGLGLAIVRQIAQRSGGDVHLDEAPGGGLRARLVLPSAGRPDAGHAAVSGHPLP
ncbi:MAG TPA: HAMP domain-containing sensor histidine kinase [Nocardioidaceae bacterium]|nr:HAMP domain-containing sensor histidine kinase [Nocardioidaceae bacterium]